MAQNIYDAPGFLERYEQFARQQIGLSMGRPNGQPFVTCFPTRMG